MTYLRLDDPGNRQTIRDNVLHIIRSQGITRFEYLLPDEYRLNVQLHELTHPCRCPAAQTTPSSDLTRVRKPPMESFYRRMRKRFDVLMEGEQPAGGGWNFDTENRRSYAGRVPIPPPLVFENDVSEIVDTIRGSAVKTFGEIDPRRLIWPIGRPQALKLLAAFIADALPHFGTYYDAMTVKNWSLFHCRFSFALNVKMLHPLEVVTAAVDALKDDPQRITIQQVEGFVRQILGWREYMRGVYWALMPDFAGMDFFGHDLPLPDFYWTAETLMACLSASVGQSLEHAYAHHIQRLMVTGNFALLAGIHPDEVDAWYLDIYIDAIQWVEMPNTRGMSQFADGGIVATKPYVSSANYINRMSDYCGSCRYDPKKKYGEAACPFNPFYWDFYNRHRDKLAANPRIGMMYRTWDRMAAAERKRILQQAEIYRRGLYSL